MLDPNFVLLKLVVDHPAARRQDIGGHGTGDEHQKSRRAHRKPWQRRPAMNVIAVRHIAKHLRFGTYRETRCRPEAVPTTVTKAIAAAATKVRRAISMTGTSQTVWSDHTDEHDVANGNLGKSEPRVTHSSHGFVTECPISSARLSSWALRRVLPVSCAGWTWLRDR